MTALVPLVVVLPLIGAAITLAVGRRRRLQIAVSVTTLSLICLASIALLVFVDASGPAVVHVGGWPAPWGIVLVVDTLSAIMLVISSLMLLGVLLFSVGQGIIDGDRDTPVTIFHPTYLVLAAGIFDTFVAGDVFNLYVGFEMLLSASYVLLTLGGTGTRIRVGVTYIAVSLLSSMLFLAAIALLYGATGTVTLALLADRIAELPADVQLVLNLLLLLAFCVKAAVFPLSFWLPDSYPTAPAPITAVFAGLLTKVGVYAVIRTQTLLFPGDRLFVPLMAVALLTMIVGILGALAQADIKRLLSFTLVSHIGYMIFGIALGTRIGMTATIYYVVHHIAVQTALFLVAGLIERVGGSTSLARLAALAKAAPFIAGLYFVGALNLGGIPPFSGFLGKLALFQAGAEAGDPLSYALIGAGAATSLLTLYALMRVWNMAFWRTEGQAESAEIGLLERPEGYDEEGAGPAGVVSRLMTVSATAMVAFTVALTVFAGPIFDLTARAATQVSAPSDYIAAVFPEGAP